MLLLLAALTYLVLISELVLPSDPLCPCRQEGETVMRCDGWADWCPRAPLPSTSLLAITASPDLSTINISNINSQVPGMEQPPETPGNY